MRFRAPGAGELLVAPLDDLIAIYHRASGQTHLVVSPVPELLAAMAGEWLDAEALLAKLTVSYDLADPDPTALAERLDELVETGLVERA